jgi:hypothetical protein
MKAWCSYADGKVNLILLGSSSVSLLHKVWSALVRTVDGLYQYTLIGTAYFKFCCVRCLYRNVGIHKDLLCLYFRVLHPVARNIKQ